MALNINGTTGISGVDGSVSAPAVTGTDSNTGITFPSADTIKFSTGGVERLSITNSGVTGTGISNGKVLQVVEGSTSTQVAISTDTYSDIGISADITPQTNSKVLVLVNFLYYLNGNAEEGFGIKLLRGSDVLYTSPPNPSEWYFNNASTSQIKDRATFHYYDAAPSGDGSTSITYKIQVATYGSRTVEFAVSGARSTITLIEIGA